MQVNLGEAKAQLSKLAEDGHTHHVCTYPDDTALDFNSIIYIII